MTPLDPLPKKKHEVLGRSYTYGPRIINFCPKTFGEGSNTLKRLNTLFCNIRMMLGWFFRTKSIFEKKVTGEKWPFLRKIAVSQHSLEKALLCIFDFQIIILALLDIMTVWYLKSAIFMIQKTICENLVNKCWLSVDLDLWLLDNNA